MKRIAALLITLCAISLTPAVVAADIGFNGTFQVRSIGSDRIAVVIPEGQQFRIIVYEDFASVPEVPSQLLQGTVTYTTGRLLINSPSFNFDGRVGADQTGWAIASYYIPGTVQLGNIAWDRIDAYIEGVSSDSVTCGGGHATVDTQCQFGGPMSLKSPSFTCAITNAGSPHVLQFQSQVGSAGELNAGDCKPGSYPCGYCDGWGNANQGCKYDTCQSEFPPPIKCH